MTRWKPVLLLTWGVGVILLAGTWLGSRFMTCEAQAPIGSKQLVFGLRRGSVEIGTIPFYFRHTSPFDISIRSATASDPDRQHLVLKFIPLLSPGIRILNIPIWSLTLLHTAFFALLYLLARRHYKKTSPSPP